MPTALIIEDDPIDLRQAAGLLTELGFDKIEQATNASKALRFLEDVAERKSSAPDLLVLDLSLGYESGFEVLRRWKSDKRLKPIKIIVWTQMGEREQELCRLFGLEHIVPKWRSAAEFKTALQVAMGNSPQRPSEAS